MRIILAMASLASFLCLIAGGALAGVGIIIVTHGLFVGYSTPPKALIAFLGIGIPVLAAGIISQWWLHHRERSAPPVGFEVVQGKDRSGT